jgi:hypothetical protein
VAITPIVRSHLGKVFTRERGPLESTDFSISRFLVPYLCGYEGFAVYLDCDMVALADVWDLVVDEWWERAVWVVKHDYVPKGGPKMDGRQQTTYARKNWSSLMVFNNAQCRALTPEYVNTASGLDLHRFAWLTKGQSFDRPEDPRAGRIEEAMAQASMIGALPLEWNWLVGEYEQNPAAKILHYTLGGPWMDGHRACDHAEEWLFEREQMLQGEAWKASEEEMARGFVRRPLRSPWPPGVESA